MRFGLPDEKCVFVDFFLFRLPPTLHCKVIEGKPFNLQRDA